MFRYQIARLGRELVSEYLGDGWRFEWDNAKIRAGSCNHTDSKITLSRILVLKMTDEDVKDTLLHEIAHALVGPGHGHDEVWEERAKSLGCSAERCHEYDTSTGAKFYAECSCGTSHHWFRKPKRRYRCRTCKELLKVKPVPNE